VNKVFKIAAIVLLIFTGLNALISGALFMADPSGKLMGMSKDYLLHSPFRTFLFPGIVLFLVNGLMNIMASVYTLKNHPLSFKFIVLQGILLSGWIVLQVIMVRDFNMLHGIMLGIGVLLMACGLFIHSIASSDTMDIHNP